MSSSGHPLKSNKSRTVDVQENLVLFGFFYNKKGPQVMSALAIVRFNKLFSACGNADVTWLDADDPCRRIE